MERPHFDLLICSAQDGHLGRLHLMAIMSNAAVNTHAQVFVRTYVFHSSGCTPGRGLLGHLGTLCLMFQGATKLFPTACSHSTFPPAHRGSLGGFGDKDYSLFVLISLIFSRYSKTHFSPLLPSCPSVVGPLPLP